MNRRSRRTALAAALCLAAAGSVFAQTTPPRTETVRPPTPRKSDDPPVFWNFFALIVMAGAIFGANMIPSKRGHQD